MTEQSGKKADPINNIIEVSALDPVARVDPHPRLKQLREEAPVFRDEDNKCFMLSEYETVRGFVNDRTLHRHPRLTEEGALVRNMVEEEDEDERMSILFMDEPDHSRVRLPIAKALYSRINRSKAVIEEIVRDVIAKAPKGEAFDLMNEIAVPVPILVIARILGVEEDRVKEFRAWSEAAILSLNPLRTPEESELLEWGRVKLEDHFKELMEARRKEPRDDLISDLVALQAEGVDLSDGEIRVNLGGLLIGGNLTTTDLIGNAIWLLLTVDNQYQKLVDKPELIGAAVEEALRYEAPVAITTRVIPDEREVGGCPMHASHSVFASLHAANRDPKVFDDPERFNIEREHIAHVAFGGGSHICIGAPLARMEAKAALANLVERYPDLTLKSEEIKWRTLPFFRGIEELIVEG